MSDIMRTLRRSMGQAQRHWLANSLGFAIAVATLEAEASGLPGRVNGPADAYRHIVWVAEMTRRMGPNGAHSYAEFHEWTGQASGSLAERTGSRREDKDLAAASAMDRRNNLLGVTIGQRARTFDEVLAMARQAIERSPRDGSGGMIGAVWLPMERWSGRAIEGWPYPDLSKAPTAHVEAHAARGEEYRFVNHRLSAEERRAALRAERRADWQRLLDEDERAAGESGEAVHVRAYLRDGHRVKSHQRSAPD